MNQQIQARDRVSQGRARLTEGVTSPRFGYIGFTLIELLVVIAVIGMLVALVLPVLSKRKERCGVSVERLNFKQIALAVNMFVADNQDHLPYTGWGGYPPPKDNWAYSKDIPDGRGTDSPLVISNQIESFKRGQLGPYLGQHVAVLNCPKDVRNRTTIRGRQDFVRRRIKITSYTWNGAPVGYEVTPPSMPFSKYTVSRLRPTGILLWEAPESHLFNDVSSYPHEGITQRHVPGGHLSSQRRFGENAPVASLDGRVWTVGVSEWVSPELAGRNVWPQVPNPDGPNDAWYNPASADGTY